VWGLLILLYPPFRALPVLAGNVHCQCLATLRPAQTLGVLGSICDMLTATRCRVGDIGFYACNLALCVSSRSTYFAMTSTSRFTGVPGGAWPSVVSSRVCRDQGHLKPVPGFVAQRGDGQRNTVDSDRALFRPRSGPNSAGRPILTTSQCSAGERARICPVPSTCPCTMCPPSRLFTAAARSRLTGLPAASRLKLDRLNVSPITSAVNRPGGQHLDHRQAHAVDGDRIAVTGIGG